MVIATKAWMLRRDGQDFPVKMHIYNDRDDDLSTSAEACAFILQCGIDDKDLAVYVLDAWMAIGLSHIVGFDDTPEQLLEKLENWLGNLPYKFPYNFSVSEFMEIHERAGNWDDFDSMMDFVYDVEHNLDKVWQEIEGSLNQQFIRVRYGGEYNSEKGNNEIWFRIGSKGFNWADIIYMWVINHYKPLSINAVNISRDIQSDHGYTTEYKKREFYKAKDGALYNHMPIDEFLGMEHENKMVFAVDKEEAIAASRLNICEYDLHAIYSALANGIAIRTIAATIGWEDEIGDELRDYEIATQTLSTPRQKWNTKVRR